MAGRIAARIEGQVDGELHGYADGILTLRSDKAYPPGRPLACELAYDTPMALKGRTIGSKRQDDGRFLVRVRLTNLRKQDREQLEQSFPADA